MVDKNEEGKDKGKSAEDVNNDDNKNNDGGEDEGEDIPLGEEFFSKTDKISGKKGALTYEETQALIDAEIEKREKEAKGEGGDDKDKEDKDKNASPNSEGGKDDPKGKKSEPTPEEQAEANKKAEAFARYTDKVSQITSLYKATKDVDIDDSEVMERTQKLAKAGEKIDLKTVDKICAEIYKEKKEEAIEKEKKYKESKGGGAPLSRDRSVVDDGRGGNEKPVNINEQDVFADFNNFRNSK